jgi:hypothetical protein
MIWRPRIGNHFKFWMGLLELGYDFYETKDLIDEQIGRRLMCECEILN